MGEQHLNKLFFYPSIPFPVLNPHGTGSEEGSLCIPLLPDPTPSLPPLTEPSRKGWKEPRPAFPPHPTHPCRAIHPSPLQNSPCSPTPIHQKIGKEQDQTWISFCSVELSHCLAALCHSPPRLAPEVGKKNPRLTQNILIFLLIPCLKVRILEDDSGIFWIGAISC